MLGGKKQLLAELEDQSVNKQLCRLWFEKLLPCCEENARVKVQLTTREMKIVRILFSFGFFSLSFAPGDGKRVGSN